ncbi:protein O-GlcNAcase isoform X2 [Anguilla anguilla]|uniref:protein O-GlcNAcase isoform X2 n=1 Tax=Anguilla anguilla TaxID=7936 RepID=UPI0015A7BF9F|nr:protein O-GlcNAcase isoform X2 [Anguilla anguilla]
MEDKSEFLCGVVEGFYGRPWSVEQRKVLFQWMQRWGLNTYLYGPKDDLKHRLLWRELYSPEEEAQLKTLVREAELRGLRFVYALSPGQDMVFSSSCDLTLLKRKLRQVTELGCQAFALLFDDIDHSLSQADSEAFSSFAHAQVSVANEIFRFLGEPSVFLFCPTEYCGSLCSPSVAKSPYLLTVGEDLLPGISVIWTGSKVISRELSADSLVEVQNVLQRPLLVWDNLHANDYDSRRVFLGPFKGRPPSLRSQLQGLLLNPNCEFEANYIPLHTLGHWHRTGAQILKGGAGQYCPEEALSAALQDWMEELSQPLQPGRQVRPSELGSSGSISKSADNPPTSRGSKLKPPLGTERWDDFPSAVPPSATPATKQGGAEDMPTDRGEGCEETRPEEAREREREGQGEKEREGGEEGERARKKDQGPGRGVLEKGQGRGLGGGKAPLSEKEVRLLVGLYFLPHEHGRPGQSLLQDLTWLKTNSHCVSANGKKGPPPKVEEWRVRAGRFLAACDDVARLHVSVVNSVNRAVLYDLYPYIWDLRNTVLVAKAFVSWLDGRVLNDTQSLSSWRNCFHWCGVAMGADVLGVESEPWVFKGGLSGEVQMLLPIGTSTELFTHPPPLFPTCRLYNIRPFQLKDKVELYRMVRQLHLKTQGKQDSALPHPDLIGDRYLGASLALCPEYSFVLEDELGVCGGALGVLDVRSFSKRYQASWLPAMRDKYPTRPHGGAQEALLQFQEEQADYPDSLLYHFPSQVWLDALPELVDCSLTRSLLTALLTALKANGSQGVFCDVLPTDRQRLELLAKLGFLEILRGEARPREGVVLGRLL